MGDQRVSVQPGALANQPAGPMWYLACPEVPGGWYTLHGLSATPAAAVAFGDANQDGLSNGRECFWGGNPTNAQAFSCGWAIPAGCRGCREDWEGKGIAMKRILTIWIHSFKRQAFGLAPGRCGNPQPGDGRATIRNLAVWMGSICLRPGAAVAAGLAGRPGLPAPVGTIQRLRVAGVPAGPPRRVHRRRTSAATGAIRRCVLVAACRGGGCRSRTRTSFCQTRR